MPADFSPAIFARANQRLTIQESWSQTDADIPGGKSRRRKVNDSTLTPPTADEKCGPATPT